MKKIKIFIADDHNLFRDGLKLLLGSFSDMEVAGEASNGKELLDKIDDHSDNIVLLDIDMPEMSGIEAAEKATGKYPDLKIIALSMFGDAEYYYGMIEAGAKGFLLKNSNITEVEKAIRTVEEGGSYFSPELLFEVVKNIRKIKERMNMLDLTERETEILYHICKGMSNQEVADLLNLSKRTVDKHRSNLLAKTNSKNTASLVVFAIKNKLVKI
ncbi:MAG: response regulator transcription factor [Bacteroidales bacterium]|nr:response regulator transcription factor [Bacteroidales bacterium]MCF8345001.1 response regulator transcription factor [Bacteroidales bacterium]MCF8352064.1 response regulator transcription factor [Bacteroidales bacterium]MCF8377497.1 response regulator transcription factor [Bacteroidales bacterium]MCF8401620.1 response regulator transcription factor [Bacteroidales bacterium]